MLRLVRNTEVRMEIWPAAETRPDADKPASIVSSQELLGGARELLIQHGRERYRLILTRSNKLILIK